MIIYLSMLDTNEEKSKFEQLYHKYRYTMLYTANNILQDINLSEDAVHEAFIRIAKNFHKVGPVDSRSTKAFAVIITRNVALTMAKEKSGYVIPEEEIIRNTLSDVNREDIFAKAAFEAIVKQITLLPETYKDVIYLRFVNELPVKTIGEILDLPTETVKKRIQRGRKILIDRLYKEGLADER